jgi:hypothetical protein
MTRYFSIQRAAKTAGLTIAGGEHENGFGPETAENNFNQRREVQNRTAEPERGNSSKPQVESL